MGCAGCATQNGKKPAGCGNSGGCGNGSCSCNQMNSFDWLSMKGITDVEPFQIVEVSFKNGARKEFHYNPTYTQTQTGDMVVVEARGGYDVGQITLSGELVRLQMKKKRVKPNGIYPKVQRLANERDLDRLHEARQLEPQIMSRARVLSRTLGLSMKVGDVEYRGDLRKIFFYYTADGRIDYRQLIEHYKKEFRTRVEMCQIGARQESGRVGGIGSCGRELCCSTWLSSFKSVTTSTARYQNLAINQTKLSGQCGRLKCCLNYELDTYMDALQHFPKKADNLYTQYGRASLVKTDIFKGLMHYYYKSGPNDRGRTITLTKDRVAEVLKMNSKGEKPIDLVDYEALSTAEDKELDFESVNDVIELPKEKKTNKKRRRNKKRNRRNRNKSNDKKSPSPPKRRSKKNKKNKGKGGKQE